MHTDILLLPLGNNMTLQLLCGLAITISFLLWLYLSHVRYIHTSWLLYLFIQTDLYPWCSTYEWLYFILSGWYLFDRDSCPFAVGSLCVQPLVSFRLVIPSDFNWGNFQCTSSSLKSDHPFTNYEQYTTAYNLQYMSNADVLLLFFLYIPTADLYIC